MNQPQTKTKKTQFQCHQRKPLPPCVGVDVCHLHQVHIGVATQGNLPPSGPNKSWHRRVDNIPMVKHPALLWPFLASDQHLFQGFMGVMSSYTLQLGPRSGAALFRTWQGDPCHHVIHGADQLQLLFCGSKPLEQGHPNLSTDLSKRPATHRELLCGLKLQKHRWLLLQASLESNRQLFVFPTLASCPPAAPFRAARSSSICQGQEVWCRFSFRLLLGVVICYLLLGHSLVTGLSDGLSRGGVAHVQRSIAIPIELKASGRSSEDGNSMKWDGILQHSKYLSKQNGDGDHIAKNISK